jgi:hypothetical protein
VPANANTLAPAPNRHPIDPSTLGGALERRRLEVRALRLERVLAILHRRAATTDAATTERALHRAIRDFQQELDDVHEHLHASRVHHRTPP